jgi:hypothetical protein
MKIKAVIAALRSQAGYFDVRAEMRAVDSLGPLARRMFNESPRELSVKDIVADYRSLRPRVRYLCKPRNDAAFAKWLANKYRLMAGHDIDSGVERRR